ncbi:hypothetical protein [Actinocorallia longicatena]|uniref:Mercuric ion transport protein n=1 Tax=Actinocorallia longicatena TaxID=111803 RepID=A0ABP6QD87_9ACTN
MTSSKTGTGLGLMAAVACVACCALPILVTAGILSGGGAVLLADKMPLIAGVLAAAAAGVFAFAAWRRSHRTSCAKTTETGGGCGGQSGCGCATTPV